MFNEDLKFSESLDSNFWNKIYSRAFPNHISFFRSKSQKESDMQQYGIDTTVVLSSGKPVFVEEKIRRKNYGDILLEVIANDKTSAMGWIEKDQMSDYILYIICETEQVYVLPTIQLQQAWRKNKDKWLEEFGTVPAKNPNYESVNCPVPIQVLYNALKQELVFNLQGEN